MQPSASVSKVNLGVIVARFQVDRLTVAHTDLIRAVRAQCDRVLIFLGYNDNPPNKRNPLSTDQRRMMLNQYFDIYNIRNVEIQAIRDLPGQDDLWSQNLDHLIEQAWHLHGGTVRLFGGRDSFVPFYRGRYPVTTIADIGGISGTEARKLVQENFTPDFRKGVVWATQKQFDRVFPTVDIAVIDDSRNRILMGKKPGETLWRFPGGFVDPADYSLEAAAIRELKEETGLTATRLHFVTSMKVGDPRFRGPDTLMTSLFVGHYGADVDQVERISAGDDLAEVEWVLLSGWAFPQIAKEHRELFAFLLGGS